MDEKNFHLLQVPPRSALGSPSVPGGHEHSARWSTALQFAVGLQQGEPPQKVGPHGSVGLRHLKGTETLDLELTYAGGVVAGAVIGAGVVLQRGALPSSASGHPVP